MPDPVVGESSTLHVPGVRGDGVNVGVVGTAQDGWAVSGESKKQVGVRGVCDNGWGVAGESKDQVGVRGSCDPGWGIAGLSKSGLGVHGQCETGDAILGRSESGRGVVGVAKTATAVEGNSASGAGVWGTSEKGIGVFGKGGHLAARFEGKVEITQDLTVRGVSVAALLERIARLEETVARLAPPTGVQASSGKPQISVVRENSGVDALFRVTGSGFQPNKRVRVRVVLENFQVLSDFEETASATGTLQTSKAIPCVTGIILHFSATDGRADKSDATGFLWSNTYDTTCP